jgi:hypothetical protein
MRSMASGSLRKNRIAGLCCDPVCLLNHVAETLKSTRQFKHWAGAIAGLSD